MLIYISNELDGVILKLSEEFPLGTDVIATVFVNCGMSEEQTRSALMEIVAFGRLRSAADRLQESFSRLNDLFIDDFFSNICYIDVYFFSKVIEKFYKYARDMLDRFINTIFMPYTIIKKNQEYLQYQQQLYGQ